MPPQGKQQNSCKGSQTSPGLGFYHLTSDLSTPHWTPYFNNPQRTSQRNVGCYLSYQMPVLNRDYVPNFTDPIALLSRDGARSLRWFFQMETRLSETRTLNHMNPPVVSWGYLSWGLTQMWILWYQVRVVKVIPISHLSLFFKPHISLKVRNILIILPPDKLSWNCLLAI